MCDMCVISVLKMYYKCVKNVLQVCQKYDSDFDLLELDFSPSFSLSLSLFLSLSVAPLNKL